MEIVVSSEQIAKTVKSARASKKTIGFIPTLGALHAGHMSLIMQAKEQCNYVVASIFVNPTQFNDAADLERYPRQLEKDAELLREHGCDLLFAPDADEVYGGFEQVQYDLGNLEQVLEGPLRPKHFQGVVNVVERLFHFVRPDIAFFGKKDRQQLAIIRHAAKTHKWPVEIVGCPTIREKDGLAMSSRNALLNEDERKRAVALFKSLCLAEEDGFKLEPRTIRLFCVQILQRHGLVPEYFDIVHPDTFVSLQNPKDVDHAVAVVAAYCGKIRLIDNIDLYR